MDLFVCFFGLFLLFKVTQAALLVRYLEIKGEECEGKIVDFVYDKRKHRSPVVEFYDASGNYIKEIPVFYNTGSISFFILERRRIGQIISIMYDPRDPRVFLLKSSKISNVIISSILFLISLAIIALGALEFTGHTHMF